MRHDMFKVIVERPRRGGHGVDPHRERRHAGYGDDGEAPARESLRARHRDRKWLNENLRPLERWLHAQVGRPWDKVFAELCEVIDRRSTVQQHIHQHVDDFIVRRVVRIDGVLHRSDGPWGPTPLAEVRWQELYVDPDSGLLRENKARARSLRDAWREYDRDRVAPPTDRRELDPSRQLHRRDGVWYEVDLAPIVAVAEATRPLFDVLRHRPVRKDGEEMPKRRSVGSDDTLYGRRDVYGWRRRQLAAKELQRHGLSNDDER